MKTARILFVIHAKHGTSTSTGTVRNTKVLDEGGVNIALKLFIT